MIASADACINIPANARTSQPMSERLSFHFFVPILMGPSIHCDAAAVDRVYAVEDPGLVLTAELPAIYVVPALDIF